MEDEVKNWGKSKMVLIYDEVKTGSKHYGGASEYFKVRPDLLTLGKAIGGGIPISAVTGSDEIMQTVGPGKTPHAGTFNSNPLSIDAVNHHVIISVPLVYVCR